MGNTVSHVLVVAVLCIELCAGNQVNVVIGLAGAGKTSIIGRVCGRPMSPSNGIDAGTLQVEEVNCNGQILVDTVGLMHMAKDVKIEDAYFEGLNGLLKYMDGKKIGRIYIVTDSTYIRDSAARVLDQVDFLKSVVNPLIPWTGVINCINGICPSTLPAESRHKFQSLLNDRVGNMIEVVSPHLQEVSKEKFPVPVAYYPVNLPNNWESLIQSHKISSLRDDMTSKARKQCDEYKKEIESTLTKAFHCGIATCQAADCNTIAECPAPQCPDFPCASEGSCERHRREAYRCRRFGSSCHRDIRWKDQGCINSVNECHQRRSDSCNNHNNARNN